MLGAGGAHAAHAGAGRDFEASPAQPSAVRRPRYAIDSTTGTGRHARIRGAVNGKPFTAQVERGVGKNPLACASRTTAAARALVLSAARRRTAALMPYKAPPDMSRFLLSPMPGLLVDVAVRPGQKVQAGERLAVIEAMKMENILVAAQDGIVAEVLAAKGESLAVDQPILSFA